MPSVRVNPDGSITVVKDQAEIVAYYDKLISRRMEAMVKLMALGGDIESLKNRIAQLSSEKKQKLMEAQNNAEIDSELCIHCGLCSLLCPVNAVKQEEINNSICIQCKECLANCPESAISIN